MFMKELRAYLRLGAGTLLPFLLFLLPALFLRPGTEEETPLPEPTVTVTVTVTAAPASAPEEPRVTLLTDSGTWELGLEEYLFGVVAAEMPAAFPPEALKAQAVAARTDTVRRMGSSPHPPGTCCADPGCCRAWLPDTALRERWGADYDRWAAVIRQAVEETAGTVLLYQGEPILAVFHACSPGSTEASENVWLEALPYLRSVSSPETADSVPEYYSTVEFSWEELRRVALKAVPEADLSGPEEDWLSGAEYTESGRLRRVMLGGAELTGSGLRMLLGLRSAAFTWTCGTEGIRFSVRGYGHGVGMSQYGARQMALDGADWQEILAHYYPGAVPGSLDQA